MAGNEIEELVRYEVCAGVAVVTFNRPDQLNAWTPRLERAYGRALDAATADRDVRAIVVTGAGRGFCAGADAGVLDGYSRGDRPAANSLPRPQTDFERIVPKPVIAAVNGACAGIGLARALFCDMRFAGSEAFFTTSYARRGLVAEHGTAWLLPRLVGPSRAADMLFSARRVTAAEAHRIGLVDELTTGSVRDAAVAYAHELAEHCSPAALAVIKEQLWADTERPLQAAYEDAELRSQRRYDTPDFKEGILSWREKRPARFAPLDPDTLPGPPG